MSLLDLLLQTNRPPGIPSTLGYAPGQQVFLANPLEQPKVSERQREDLSQFMRGRVAGSFAAAPDLIDMISRGPVQPYYGPGALEIARQLAEQGVELPQQNESLLPGGGDPIRDLLGVDKDNLWSMAGELVGIEGPLQMAQSALAKAARFAPEVAALAGTVPPIIKGADKAEKAGEVITEAVRLPKITAKRFVDQGHTQVGRRRFNEHLAEARQFMSKKDRAQVDPFLPDDFKGKVYMTADGEAGFALSDEGYVSHVFKNPEAPFRGTLGAALTKARAAGAKDFHAFDAGLVEGYLATGAREIERGPFDPSQATQEVIEGLGARAPEYVHLNVGGQVPTQKHSLILGPRVQQELKRFHAARGEPQTVTDAFKGGRVARLNRLVDKGIEQGGDKWYWLGGLLDQFIAQFGKDIGPKRFERFMELNAGLSPRSTVSKEIQRASILYQREVNGLPIEKMFQPPGTEKNPRGLLHPHWPEGYGHLANDIHMGNVVRLLEQGGFDPIDQAKIASYLENLKGNYRPVTVDTHNAYVLTGKRSKPTKKSPLGDPMGPTEAQYPYFESRQQELAARRGLDPAEWQSALWVGAGDITGVVDVRNFPDAMNVRIAQTAEILDIPEQEALVRFMNGDTHLYSVMAALLGAGVFKEASEAGESDREQ
jgi:hypothetical protein